MQEAAQTSIDEPGSPEESLLAHADYLFKYAVVRVRDEPAAEDVVQETLLAALEKPKIHPHASSERAWLTGILRNKIYDHFRRVSRERTVFEEEPLPEELSTRYDDRGLWKMEPALGPAEWGPDAAEQMQRGEFMLAFKATLGKLPVRYADAFVLREMEGVESSRIQEILGITASNFWVLMHRARAQLRLCLETNWLNL